MEYIWDTDRIQTGTKTTGQIDSNGNERVIYMPQRSRYRPSDAA